MSAFGFFFEGLEPRRVGYRMLCQPAVQTIVVQSQVLNLPPSKFDIFIAQLLGQ